MSFTSLSLTGNPFGPFDVHEGYQDPLPRAVNPNMGSKRREERRDPFIPPIEHYRGAQPAHRRPDVDRHYRDTPRHPGFASARHEYRDDQWLSYELAPPPHGPNPLPAHSHYSVSYTCLIHGCAAMPFSRKADLDRHCQQVHKGHFGGMHQAQPSTSYVPSPLGEVPAPDPVYVPPRAARDGDDANPFEYQPDRERRWRQAQQAQEPYAPDPSSSGQYYTEPYGWRDPLQEPARGSHEWDLYEGYTLKMTPAPTYGFPPPIPLPGKTPKHHAAPKRWRCCPNCLARIKASSTRCPKCRT